MTITVNNCVFDKVKQLSADRETRRTDITYNTQGDMLIDLVVRKYKLTVTFGLLTEDEMKQLRQLCGEIFVTVKFPSPEGEQTADFHIVEEPAPTAAIVDGVRLYGGVRLVMLQK